MPSGNRRAQRVLAVLVWLLNAWLLAMCILWVYGHYQGDSSFQRTPWVWFVFALNAVAGATWLWLRRRPTAARSPEDPLNPN